MLTGSSSSYLFNVPLVPAHNAWKLLHQSCHVYNAVARSAGLPFALKYCRLVSTFLYRLDLPSCPVRAAFLSRLLFQFSFPLFCPGKVSICLGQTDLNFKAAQGRRGCLRFQVLIHRASVALNHVYQPASFFYLFSGVVHCRL